MKSSNGLLSKASQAIFVWVQQRKSLLSLVDAGFGHYGGPANIVAVLFSGNTVRPNQRCLFNATETQTKR